MSAKPSWHLPDLGIFEYANGATSAAAALAIACHLHQCERCRGELQICDQIAGTLLEALPPAALGPGALARLIARLDETPAEAITPAPIIARSPLPAPLDRLDLPPALRRVLESAPPQRWRTLVPGAKAIDLTLTPPPPSPIPPDHRTTVRILRMRPGFTIPLHDHAGPEYTVIFTGGLADSGRASEPGDVLYREPGTHHVQQATAGEECIALVVNEGPLVPLTLKGRVLGFIAGV